MLKARRLSLYAPRIRERYDRFYIRASARSSRREGGGEGRQRGEKRDGLRRGTSRAARGAEKKYSAEITAKERTVALESLSFYGFPSAPTV